MNPFFFANLGGHPTYHVNADDRLSVVRGFDLAQCRAALTLPDLQRTVRVAVERRKRALERDIEARLRAVSVGPERGR